MRIRLFLPFLISLILPLMTVPFAAAQSVMRESAEAPSVVHTLRSNDHTGFVLDIRFPTPRMQKSRLSPTEYFVLEIDGCYGAADPGKPNLPHWNRLIELPADGDFTVVTSDELWLDLVVPEAFRHMLVEPVQPSVSKSHKGELPRYFDTAVYSQNDWFRYSTATVLGNGILRDARIARLSVSPVEYNPATGRLRYLASATITLQFTGSDPAAREMQRATLASPYINTSSLTLNGSESSTIQIEAPVHYVILSDSMFLSALQPFITWKRRKGFMVTEVYKGSPGVGTTAASIKSYLTALYHAATPALPAPSFLLIVGDIQQIPSFPQSASPGKPTDMPYAEYTGDIYPDLLYGRFSASTIAELQAQIDKTLYVEQYQISDPSYLQNMLLIAGVDGDFSPLYANGHIHYAANEYVNASNNLTAHTWYYPASAGQTAPILQRINQGVSLVNYTAHAGSTGWQDPAFTNGHVATLTNTGMYPVVISNACSSNEFHFSSCFGETLLRAQSKGAVGHIGGANLTYWDEDYHFAVGLGPILMHPTYPQSDLGFFDRLFHSHGEPYPEWAITQGAIIHAGNLAVTQSGSPRIPYYWEVYHLMGDPSLMPWLGIPSPITATIPPALPAGISQVTVHAPPYSYIAITSGSTVHGAAVANSFGTATVFITPFTQPTATEVFITGQNLIPRSDSLHFVVPTGPFVMADSTTFHDYAGNNNQLVEAGEPITVDVRLRNFTAFTAGPLTVTLSCTDPYVQLTDSVVTIPFGLAGLNSLILQNAFAFNVASFVPDQHPVQVVITATDGTGTWTAFSHFVINSPVVRLTGITLSDEPGNNNGKVEPGEPFFFAVTLKNTGHAPMQSLPVTIEHNSPLLTLDSTTKILPLFETGNSYTLHFTGTAYNTTFPEGLFVRVKAIASLNGYTDTLISYRMLAPVIEDFGTGASSFPWTFTGSQHWYPVPDTPYTGQYCMRSGAIPNQSHTRMSITIPVISSDTISFMYRVSSEEAFDFLRFTINQTEMGRWSGIQDDWRRAAFPVDSGEITFTWSYEKDHTFVAGQDCAWIDYIVFPPTSLLSSVERVSPVATLQIYPNPTLGSLTIILNETADKGGVLRVFSVDGQLTHHQPIAPGEKQITLDSGMPVAGLYLIRVDTPNGSISRKIVRF
jgi:hypothetical protein